MNMPSSVGQELELISETVSEDELDVSDTVEDEAKSPPATEATNEISSMPSIPEEAIASGDDGASTASLAKSELAASVNDISVGKESVSTSGITRVVSNRQSEKINPPGTIGEGKRCTSPPTEEKKIESETDETAAAKACADEVPTAKAEQPTTKSQKLPKFLTGIDAAEAEKPKSKRSLGKVMRHVFKGKNNKNEIETGKPKTESAHAKGLSDSVAVAESLEKQLETQKSSKEEDDNPENVSKGKTGTPEEDKGTVEETSESKQNGEKKLEDCGRNPKQDEIKTTNSLTENRLTAAITTRKKSKSFLRRVFKGKKKSSKRSSSISKLATVSESSEAVKENPVIEQSAFHNNSKKEDCDLGIGTAHDMNEAEKPAEIASDKEMPPQQKDNENSTSSSSKDEDNGPKTSVDLIPKKDKLLAKESSPNNREANVNNSAPQGLSTIPSITEVHSYPSEDNSVKTTGTIRSTNSALTSTSINSKLSHKTNGTIRSTTSSSSKVSHNKETGVGVFLNSDETGVEELETCFDPESKVEMPSSGTEDDSSSDNSKTQSRDDKENNGTHVKIEKSISVTPLATRDDRLVIGTSEAAASEAAGTGL